MPLFPIRQTITAAGLAALPLASLALLSAGPARYPQAPSITTEQLTSRMSTAIEGLRSLRCTVKAQERIAGKIVPARSLMKMTFKPFRVYVKNQKGVEVLWVTGQNDGDAWVYPASFPYVTLSLDPRGKLMRSGQHHTVLQAGFGTISELLRTTGLRQDAAFSRSFRYVGDSTVQGRPAHILRSDYPQFRYVSYKAGKNETLSTVAERFGCGEYRVMERNNLDADEKIPEGKILQVPNSYGRRTILSVDTKTFLPTMVQVHDDKGLFEKFEFTDVVPNQNIPLEEFSKDYPSYKI
ncbi:DUF1571 domain-containing protein [Hymenobacter sp. ASUV-10]|uniref:DUF1571 domain-containing protein n=1 Tax=Hymenobacter aranciens TaxID=3063996 RepID=A0ABT9BCV3_9BACT|nr:DUF1571 domain-containing protein [Hymenobacter sp. ASUV-10]MDO7876089.1 DUF1571 domain-containing protein [Hymenobacter sp. ASUV-10]